MKKKDYKNIKDFDQLLDYEYGKLGTKKRTEFEAKAELFIISKMLKEARHETKMTQEELAEKTGTKKSYISKLENGKANVQISTLIRIFEQGLNKRISITFS